MKFIVQFGLLICAFSSLQAQFQMECKISSGESSTTYRSLFTSDASKTVMNVDGSDVITLNILSKGVFTLIPEQNMAIKMNPTFLDTLATCECTLKTTGNKKTILGYETEEILQKCSCSKGTSENHIWVTTGLALSPKLISPMQPYLTSTNSKILGFPLLFEGFLNDKTYVKYEVLGITTVKIPPIEMIVPESYLVIEQ